MKILSPKIKGQGHYMTKFGQNDSIQQNNCIQMYQVTAFVNGKYLLGQYYVFLKN